MAQPAKPRRSPARAAVPPDSTYVLFGAFGDLAARKLLPAIYNLAAEGILPADYRVIGVDRADEDFTSHARQSIEQFSRSGFDAEVWKGLESRLGHIKADVTDEADYRRLADELEKGEKAMGGKAQRVFHLAVAPPLFAPIATALGEAGLSSESAGPARLMIEKPFGHDRESAAKLNQTLTSAFAEEQIYRIDHYLGKDPVENMLVVRFANEVFEPLWNRSHVSSVEITVAESLGVGHRAGYYDQAGALRDVLQNHVLQLLSYVAMEPPTTFEAPVLQARKLEALQAVVPIKPDQVARISARGRYGPGEIGGEKVPGYMDEDGVPADSQTETYAALKLEVDNWRWAGVPFYLRTGKRLGEDLTEVALSFRRAPHLPFRTGRPHHNQFVFTIQPNAGTSLSLTAKEPGEEMRVSPVDMQFDYGDSFHRESPEAYERLIHDALLGDRELFTLAEFSETAWGIVDPVLEAWGENAVPLEEYAAGSHGPESADALLAHSGHRWRSLNC